MTPFEVSNDLPSIVVILQGIQQHLDSGVVLFEMHRVCVIVIVIVISKFLKRYSKAKRTRAPAYSRALRRIKRGFPKGVKRSSGPVSRIPGEDRVAVKVSDVQVEKVNDQMGPGRSLKR